jgi:hypothetical protein
MTRIGAAVLALSAIAALAGCGADGEPIRPVTQASIGVGDRGVNGTVSTGVTRGNVSVRVGAAL